MLLRSPLSSSLPFASSCCTRPVASCVCTFLHRSISRGKEEKRECLTIVSGSVSQVHSYGTMDFENKRGLHWSSIYRRILSAEREGKATSSVLETWDELEKRLSKWELCRVAKELRKFRHSKAALEVISSCECLIILYLSNLLSYMVNPAAVENMELLFVQLYLSITNKFYFQVFISEPSLIELHFTLI